MRRDSNSSNSLSTLSDDNSSRTISTQSADNNSLGSNAQGAYGHKKQGLGEHWAPPLISSAWSNGSDFSEEAVRSVPMSDDAAQRLERLLSTVPSRQPPSFPNPIPASLTERTTSMPPRHNSANQHTRTSDGIARQSTERSISSGELRASNIFQTRRRASAV